jgi:4-amino-4-deoxy-L-arabinose transferase-like glycosyltransferase
MIKNILLIFILAVAAFFRLYGLGDNPPSLNWDEISHGYNAYSILKTGRDEWGSFLPLIFRAYGDYKLPLYIYLTVPGIAAFGLNAFSVRLISALSGVGLVLITYLIAQKITSSKKFSLFAALLTAVSPWSLFVSRVALEANLAAFLFAAGGYFFLSWIQKSSFKNLILAITAWGLSLYAYNSARVVVPLFLLALLLLAAKKGLIAKFYKNYLTAGLVILIFALPLIGQLSDQSGKARFDQMTLIDQGTVNRIIEYRQNSKLPSFFTRLIYNRPSFFAFYSVKNYLSNFSPKYLFFRGGEHYQFSQPDHELLFLVTAPFLLIGIIKVLLKGRLEERIVLFWFLAAAIPSAITRDAPHNLRTLLVLPAPIILTVIGLQCLNKKIEQRSLFKGNFLIWVLVFSVLVSFGRWWKDYSQIYRKAYSWAWQYGYQEAVLFVKDNYSKYDKIYFTKRYGEPHEFVLVYFPWDPSSFQNDNNKVWDYHAGWYWVDGFDKFVFVNDWEIISKLEAENITSKALLITSPGNFPDGWRKINSISFLDGKGAFDILENQITD